MNGDEPRTATGSASVPDSEKRESRARKMLKMSVKDCIILHIREGKLANEIWGVLKELYEIKNSNCLMFLRSKIMSMKLEENETIASFVARIKDLKNRLSDIGHTIDDTDLVTITMNGVTNDYQIFITRMNAREKIPKFEELTGMQEEERISTLKPKSSDIALMAKKNFFKGKGSTQ